jgi:ABC-type proline/glycine betaine transport system permease subunit
MINKSIALCATITVNIFGFYLYNGYSLEDNLVVLITAMLSAAIAGYIAGSMLLGEK